MAVFLRLFGGLQLEVDGRPLAGRAIQKKRLALLALLSATPHARLTRDKLIALLWPESDLERARHQLASSVYELRKALGEGAIVSAGDDLVLDRTLVQSDVTQFDEAIARGDRERAATLYTGPFLDGFFVSEAEEFERWVEGERNRLVQAYAKALEGLAVEKSRQGDQLAAVEWWRRLATHDPYNARVALRLIEALEAAGDRAGALKHAQAYGETMRNSLGVEPDPEILASGSRLRAAAAEARPSGLKGAAASSTDLRPEEVASPIPVSAPPLTLPVPRRSRRAFLAAALAVIVALMMVTVTGRWSHVLGLAGIGEGKSPTAPHQPVVLLMDSPYPSRVYDQEVIEASGTNADVLNDVLRDLPVQRVKEAAGPYWHRHEEIRQLRPDLIVIHFSAFCREECEEDRIKMRAFIEYLANTQTRFLIYSRKPPEVFGTEMKEMLGDLPVRYPDLMRRIDTFPVRTHGTPHWKDPATSAALKLRVKQILALGS